MIAPSGGIPSLPRDRYPDQLVAACSRAQAKALLDFDHHRVEVQGRAAVMLTWHWYPLAAATEPLRLLVVFQHATAHPLAPPGIQAVIDTLTFRPLM